MCEFLFSFRVEHRSRRQRRQSLSSIGLRSWVYLSGLRMLVSFFLPAYITPCWRSGSEHFRQRTQYLTLSHFRKLTQLFYDSGFIDRSNLVQDNLTIGSLQTTSNSSGVCISFRGHRCHNHRRYVAIHLIWRYNHTRPCFLDFSALCRVK